MAVHEFLKARFSFVRQDLNEILCRLEDSDLSWRPGTGTYTIAEQLLEIANKEKECLAWMQTGVWPDEGPDSFDVQTSSVGDIRASLAELRLKTYAYLDSFDAAQLDELVSCPEKWWEALRLTACPRHEVLRNIAAHEWYHTGQLITYLELRGLDPKAW